MTGALWRSAFVAALFALHPLHVESVAWISERKDVLSALFFLLTIWAYAEYAERTGAGSQEPGEASPKAEARRPKETRRPKSEVRRKSPSTTDAHGSSSSSTPQAPTVASSPALLSAGPAPIRPGPDEQADAGDACLSCCSCWTTGRSQRLQLSTDSTLNSPLCFGEAAFFALSLGFLRHHLRRAEEGRRGLHRLVGRGTRSPMRWSLTSAISARCSGRRTSRCSTRIRAIGRPGRWLPARLLAGCHYRRGGAALARRRPYLAVGLAVVSAARWCR